MSSVDETLVTDAGDPDNVAFAKDLIADEELEAKSDLRVLLKMVEGRRFLWSELARLGVSRSVVHSSGSMTYYNAGRQDAGHELMALIERADQDALFVMRKEAVQRAQLRKARIREARRSRKEGATT